MSERKQVIHVKDLIIQADHVYVERGRRGNEHQHQHQEHVHGEHEHRESSNEHHHHDYENKEYDRRRSGPFGWF